MGGKSCQRTQTDHMAIPYGYIPPLSAATDIATGQEILEDWIGNTQNELHNNRRVIVPTEKKAQKEVAIASQMR